MHVEKAPTRPTLVYDADCNFCRYWVARWREDADYRGECVPFQNPKVASRFPEISRKEWEKAVHLVDTTGRVYSGAEAVLRFRSKNPRHEILLSLYENSRTFRKFSEAVYIAVSHNRPFFSRIWGTHPLETRRNPHPGHK